MSTDKKPKIKQEDEIVVNGKPYKYKAAPGIEENYRKWLEKQKKNSTTK